MKRPELMAPAGSMAALQAALAAGADAIYLGGKQFNARQSAQNFDAEELKEAITLAHRCHAKIYVTVNTLLKESELAAAAGFLRQLYNFGADAAIVQDPGLIAVARATTPELELHASTQLTIHNGAGVQAMGELGIKRVVLARELAADQIATIRQETSIGLEVFVHGALCIAYSGQCLLSSLTGGRSGNRGQCAQPCRLPYRLQNGQSGHLLSPKDLCLYQQLPELLALGLDAWKIEGRLKRPSYVATVVGYYRRAIDSLLAGQAPAPWSQAMPELEQAFNRGFTRGYFSGRPDKDLLSTDQPGHRGIVVGFGQAGDRLLLQHPLQEGDLLQADGQELKVHDIFLSKGSARTAEPGESVRVSGLSTQLGQPVYRLQSAAQEELALDLAATHQPPPIPVQMQAKLSGDRPLQLTASAAGQIVAVTGEMLPEPAIKRAVDESLLFRQLSKSGDSGFLLENLQAEIEPGLSIPVSEINHCRRQVLMLLAEKVLRQANQLPEAVQLPPAVSCPHPPETRLAVAVSSLQALGQVLAVKQVQRVYFGASFHLTRSPAKTLAAYQEADQACKAAGVACYLRLPRILLPAEDAAWLLALQGCPVQGLLVSNWGSARLARQLRLPFVLETSLNAMNSQFNYAATSAEGFYLSPELRSSEALDILRKQAGRAFLTVHARQLLMVHEQCLLSANKSCLGSGTGCSDECSHLTDRKGYRFPLRGDATCRSYLYNSQVFSLIDHIPELLTKRYSAELMVDLEVLDEQRFGPALQCYRDAWSQAPSTDLRGRLQQIFPEGLTRGHWRRGVE
jgi:putative protease